MVKQNTSMSMMDFVVLLMPFSVHLSFLILQPATLLRVFISCRRSQVKGMGSFTYKILLVANKDALSSFLPISIPLNSSNFLTIQANISRTIA